MTSATLFREGTDLEVLLAELDSEHPGQVHVVEVNHMREGGVFGFFARPRVAVQYTLGDAAPADHGSDARAWATAADHGSDPLAALITAAEMVETGQPPAPTAPAFVGETRDQSNVEFARMLLDIAAKKAAERGIELPARTGAAAARPATAGRAPTALLDPEGPGIRLRQPARTAARTEPAAVARPAVRAAAGTPAPASPPAGTPAPANPAASVSPVGGDPVAGDPVANAAAPSAEVTGFRATNPTRVAGAAGTDSRPSRRTDAGEPVRAVSPARPAEPRDGDDRLTLRRRLAELGAPIARIPADSVHRYAAVEHLVNQLPAAPGLPDAPDAIVVVAAPAPVLARLVPLLAHRLGLSADHVWTFRAARGTTRDDRRLIEVGDAKALAAALRRPRPVASTPTLVAIGLDEDLDFPVGDDSGEAGALPGASAAEMIDALAPDAFWLHVDATRKASDTAAAMRQLGSPTALIVTGAARTTSPASVWQLDVPIALLDGRPATRSAWAVLLLDKLAETDR